MKPNAIYSKSGKGVQEASGKTSLLKRADRAVLSAVDGRATLAEVAQKVGKTFDGAFQSLIAQLDKEGFLREVAAGASSTTSSRAVLPAATSAPARAPAAKPAGGDIMDDLDFTVKRGPSVSAAPPSRPPAQADATAQQRAKEQEAALYKARQEAEARAQGDRERLRQETESKARAEAEAKIRAETEKRMREEAEVKRKAEAEAKAAREAALRAAVEAKAKAEEAERLRRRLDEERKAREAEERKRREEEERRQKEEQARRAREEEEARARQAREMEEARDRARQRQHEERLRRSQEDTRTREPTLPSLPPEPRAEPKAGAGSLDALMADLDSFSQREEEERQTREASERKLRDEKKRRAQEEAEHRAREQAAQRERERQLAAEEALRREEEEQRAQEEAERRLREVEEQRRLEAEERKRSEREARAAKSAADDEAEVARETRKHERDRERETRQRSRQTQERTQAAALQPAVKYPKARRPIRWGRPLATTLFMLLIAALGALHILPLPMADYEAAASRALGRTVKIGSGHLSLFTGAVRFNLQEVTVGGNVRIASVHAYPDIGSLIDQKKAFRRIELDGVSIPQQAIGEIITAKMRGDNFRVGRILVRNLRLAGPVPLPVFEADALIGPDGAVRSVTLRGPDSLNASLTPGARGEVEFDVTAASVAVPFVPELSLASFAMRGMANRQGMNVVSWGGAVFDGAVSGTASVRWASQWQVDGAVTARGINAAVFAPALLSEGKAEGSARFSMSGADPAKLHNGARIDARFTVGKGVLGTFDLSRVLQTSGRQYGGRTPFMEMSGQAFYDRGAVALRNVSITAGALNAGANADIATTGALAGRIVADIRTTAQPLRATLILGGTVKEPQVRN